MITAIGVVPGGQIFTCDAVLGKELGTLIINVFDGVDKLVHERGKAL